MSISTNTSALESVLERLNALPKTIAVKNGGTGADNAADARTNLGIDAAFLSSIGVGRIATGSYTGTGTSGQANAMTITVGFRPKFVAIINPEGYQQAFFISPRTSYYCDDDGTSHYENVCAWNDNGLTWYYTSGRAWAQMNEANMTYTYVAIG